MADRIAVMCRGRIVELAPREILLRKPVHPYTQVAAGGGAVPRPRPAARFQDPADGRRLRLRAWAPQFRDDGDGDATCRRPISAAAISCWRAPIRRCQGVAAMITRRRALALLGSPWCSPDESPSAGVRRTRLSQAMLAAGQLPALSERLPQGAAGDQCRRAWAVSPGTMAATCRTLIGSQKDIRIMTINGYARLVGFDRESATSARTSWKAIESEERPHLHLQDPRRPQMVGRQSADLGRLPLHLGRRVAQRGSAARRRAAGAAGRRQAAEIRDRRPAHRSLQLGRAQPGFPARHRCPAADQPGHACGLHEAVPREVPGQG